MTSSTLKLTNGQNSFLKQDMMLAVSRFAKEYASSRDVTFQFTTTLLRFATLAIMWIRLLMSLHQQTLMDYPTPSMSICLQWQPVVTWTISSLTSRATSKIFCKENQRKSGQSHWHFRIYPFVFKIRKDIQSHQACAIECIFTSEPTCDFYYFLYHSVGGFYCHIGNFGFKTTRGIYLSSTAIPKIYQGCIDSVLLQYANSIDSWRSSWWRSPGSVPNDNPNSKKPVDQAFAFGHDIWSHFSESLRRSCCILVWGWVFRLAQKYKGLLSVGPWYT